MAATAALAVAGCGGDDDSGSSGGGEGGGGGGDITVGYAGYTVSNPFFAGVAQGLRQGVEKHGYELIETNANGDSAQQLSDVENLLTQGIDYLVITPIDVKANIPAVKSAERQGVPVISLADHIAGAPVVSTLAQDHTSAAETAAEEIVAFLEEKNGSASGNVVDIMGLAGVPATAQREKGFTNVISQHPEIDVVARADGGYETDKANEVMSNILQAEPEIDAVFATNDAEAVGVISAIKSAGRGRPVGHEEHIFVSSIDGAKPAIQAIRAGELDVTVSQHPIKMAEQAVDFIAKLDAGEEVPKEVEWPSQVITPENIDSQEVKEYGIWADELSASN